MMKKYLLIVCLILLFTNMYGQRENSSKLILEGEIEFISKLPNPEEINYPDCNYSTIFNVNTDSKNTKISIVFKGIVNKKRVATANYKVGDKIRVTLIPFDNANPKIRQTQLIDHVDDFDMEVYYAIKTTKIKKFSKSIHSKDVVSKKQKVTSVGTLPIDKKANRKRQKAIKSEIRRIQKLLKSHGGTWEQWEKDISAFKSEYAKANAAKESKWIGNSFFSAGKAYADANEGNFVDAMTDFNEYLKQFNIDLIIIRIPFKGEVSGSLFSDKLSDHVVNPYAMKVTSDLLKNDIEVLDILPKLIEERTKHPLVFWYNDFDEKHPAETVSWVVAKELKKLLKRYPEYKTIPKITTYIKDTIGIGNGKQYKWPKGNELYSPKKNITFKTVVDSLENIIRIEYDKNTSPFLLIGNSFLGFPSIARGGSIPHYFMYESGFKPDVYYRSGGIGLGRLIYKKGKSYLENRRAIVYVALPESFQGNVPVIPLAASMNIDNYDEKEIITLDINNWSEHVVFTPKLAAGDTFNITKEGYIAAIGQKGISTDGGTLKVTLPDTLELNANDVLKIHFQYTSVGYSEVTVYFDGQEKSFLRSKNVKDNYYENVYFKLTKKTKNRNFEIAFQNIKRKQKIKKIKVSLLTFK
ncbi:hypothetical protein IMCC3317_09610 [Kordia antarctica]|uniref:AlgX/AlgJ SGNH hydrolase-like domain-containing protein n=1 Tax=Kordia antarctica TaxID=1218801 RepID=A0A7L4ZG52_9FLAO|nr:hypothetical protein [Kordia antarctica]QHI35615.1 hypothetical protein IMCC3317_09610 [Kordia antarctica]